MTDMARKKSAQPPALWDVVVRASHWVIAVVVIGNALITRPGGVAHVWLGWIGMAFLILRLLWGFIGTPEARFSAFPLRPRAAVTHLVELASGRPSSYASHNPAGAMMVYALWASLAVVIVTGLMLTDFATPLQVAARQAAVSSGDWSVLAGHGAALSRQTARTIKGVHELMANLMLILAVIHVAGVALESRMMRRNLVPAMIAGQRRGPVRRT